MALVTKAGNFSLATTLHDPGPHQVKGRAASGGLAAGDLVYLAASGILTKADGTAATAPALAVGIMTKDAPAGEKCVAYHGVDVNFTTGLATGARLFVGATAGRIDTAATTGGTVAIGYVTSDTTIFIFTPTR